MSNFGLLTACETLSIVSCDNCCGALAPIAPPACWIVLLKSESIFATSTFASTCVVSAPFTLSSPLSCGSCTHDCGSIPKSFSDLPEPVCEASRWLNCAPCAAPPPWLVPWKFTNALSPVEIRPPEKPWPPPDTLTCQLKSGSFLPPFDWYGPATLRLTGC